MESQPTVRRLSVQDVDCYREIRAEMLLDSPASFGASPETDKFRDADFVKRVLGHGENGVFASFDEAGTCVSVAGLVRAEALKRRHVAEIYGVYTRPESRGGGHGRRAMGALMEHARQLPGLELLQLSVSSEAPAAQALYGRLGFQEWGREPRALAIGERRPTEVHLWLPLS